MNRERAERLVRYLHRGDEPRPMFGAAECEPARHVANAPLQEGALCQCGQTRVHVQQGGARAQREIWLAGRVPPVHAPGCRGWEVLGAFMTEAEAVEACTLEGDFVGPLVLGRTLPDGATPWPRGYWPLFELADLPPDKQLLNGVAVLPE